MSRSKSSFVIGNSKPKSDGEEAKEGHREKRRLYFGNKSNVINRLNFEKERKEERKKDRKIETIL